MYRIKYNYDSGDSFNTYPSQEDILEFEWKKLDVAQENLKRIKEHYQQYEELNSYSLKNNREDIYKKNKDKDWFVNKSKYEGDDYAKEYLIKLYTDENKEIQISAPWCGYFERLNFVEIVTKGNSDNKITFN